MLAESMRNGVDFFFVGGSLITRYASDEIIAAIRRHTDIPAILFPETAFTLSLLLTLFCCFHLFGAQSGIAYRAARYCGSVVEKSNLEILPTGYMLIESGRATTVSYISNTTPIPHDKPAVAACTAMAGELLGLQIIYLDAGSGAQKPVSPEMIAAVRKSVDTPIIVGGGINTTPKAQAALEAGADVIVVGNGIEQNPDLLPEIAQIVKAFNEKVTA